MNKSNGFTRILGFMLVSVAIALLVAGCGSDNKKSTPVPASTEFESPLVLSPLTSPLVTPQDSPSYVEKGLGLYANGQYEEAMENFTQAIAQGTDVARAYGGRGSVFVAWRRYNEAVEEYTAGLAHERRADLLIGRCNAFRHLQRYEEAIRDCQEALSLQPNSPDAYLVLAGMYLDQGDTERSREYIQDVMTLAPANSKALFLLGLADLADGDATGAMQNFTEAIKLNPNEPQYYWERGFLALGLGKVDQAREDMKAILRIGDPQIHGDLMFRASAQLNLLGSGDSDNK